VMMMMMMMSSGSSREEDGQVHEPRGRRPSGTGVFQLGLADTERHVAASRPVEWRRVRADVDDGRQRLRVDAWSTTHDRPRRLVRL